MDPLFLAETRDRMCPSCRSRAVISLGHVEASVMGIRSDYRCPTCAKDFILILPQRLMIKGDLGSPGRL